MPEEGRREVVPEGIYRAKPVKASWRVSPEKKTKFLAVAFAISDGEFAGRIVSWQGWMTDNSWDRTVDSMKNMGFDTDDLRDLSQLTEEVSIDVQQEEYENDKGESVVIAKVSWVNALGAAFGDPMDPDAMATFAEKMKGRLRKKGLQGGGSSPAPRDEEGPPPIQDEDIPF